MCSEKHNILFEEKSASNLFYLGYCVGQVHFAFTLPVSARKAWFPMKEVPTHLTYVEWFTPLSSLWPGQDYGLYKILRHQIQGKQQASVIPISLI